MTLKSDCIPCLFNMAINAMRRLTSNEALVEQLTIRVLENPLLRDLNSSVTSPEIAEVIIQSMMEITNDTDPFRQLKVEQNEKAMKIYPWLKSLVKGASDPLYMAVNLAILGNSIDAMKYQESTNLKILIKEGLRSPVSENDFFDLQERLKRAKLVLYFGDNSGEIFFDRVLMETMKDQYDLEIVFIVRSVPTLNDVTLAEARLAEIDRVASIVENGIDTPLPGTILERCSQELKGLVNDADFMISKGGGNFESLIKEKSLGKDIFFLLMTKCVPYSQEFKKEINEPALVHYPL